MEFPPLDFSKIRTYPVADRANKVAVDAFAKPHLPGGSFASFLDSLPDFLAVQDDAWREMSRNRERDECREKLVQLGLIS